MCRRNVAARTDNPSFPFCSPRCKSVDLGKWLDEAYRVSSPLSEEDESEALSQHPNEEKA
jgi:uncharacterized protein